MVTKLTEQQIDPAALKAMSQFHPQVVDQVKQAIVTHSWVIIGMGMNPVVKSAKKYLDLKGIQYHFISHGSYLSGWKVRLAIKLWSGWPTFPQVFHNGILVGGYQDLKKYLP